MRVIIMGCGRVGEQLSLVMVEQGHQVVVIDKDQAPLNRLGPDFPGERICGIGFDRDVLMQAGIERAEAFASTSSSDNANIVAARIARNFFHVPRVVARLHNPRRAEVYQRLGLITVSSTTWGARRISELLTHADLAPVMSFGSGEVSMVAVEAPPLLVGRSVRDLSVTGEIMVVAITRESGEAVLPTMGTEFLEGDLIYLSVLGTSMGRLEEMLGLSVGG